MNILFSAFEYGPFLKEGGLGDVTGQLPRAMATYDLQSDRRDYMEFKGGMEARVIVPWSAQLDAPKKASVRDKIGGHTIAQHTMSGNPYLDENVTIHEVEDEFEVPVRGGGTEKRKVTVYLVDHPFFRGQPIYGPELRQRAAIFDALVARFTANGCKGDGAKTGGWSPDILHDHDWQTGLLGRLARMQGVNLSILQTTHNTYTENATEDELRAWGFSAKQIDELYAATREGLALHPNLEGLHGKELQKAIDEQEKHFFAQFRREHRGRFKLKGYSGRVINFSLVGHATADRNSTVNPFYGNELCCDQEISGNFCPIFAGLNARSEFEGIANGLFYDNNRPSFEPPDFDPNNLQHWQAFSKGKAEAKTKLLKEFPDLIQDQEVPLLGYVGRLEDGQKGIRTLIKAAKKLIAEGESFNLLLLGTGVDPKIIKELEQLQADSRKEGSHASVVFVNDFLPDLATRMNEGMDLCPVPSNYEPDGLVPKIAAMNGVPSIVTATGGLPHSIKDHVNGIVVPGQTKAERAKNFVHGMKEAIRIYRDEPGVYEEMQKEGRRRDWSWFKQIPEYARCYQATERTHHHRAGGMGRGIDTIREELNRTESK